MTPETMRSKIMAFASRPEGMSRHDASSAFGVNVRPQIRAMLDDMEARGELVGVFHPLRYRNGPQKTQLFTTKAAAAAWCAAPLPAGMKPQVNRAQMAAKIQERKAPIVRQARQELPALPVKASTEARITSATKVTIAPPFVDQRWVPDVVRPVVNPNECSAWARAATERRA